MNTNKYNPAYDNKIYQKYTKKTIENKMQNKEEFCNEFGFKFNKKIPLIGITYALVKENNVQIIEDIINGLIEQNIQLVVTSIGSKKYQMLFTKIAEQNSKKIIIVDNSEEVRRKIYAAADLFLSSGNTVDCNQEAKTSMKYGVVPIITSQIFTEDYNPKTEKGNSFIFNEKSPWSLFASIIRATESFKFPYDWKNIQKNCMETE